MIDILRVIQLVLTLLDTPFDLPQRRCENGTRTDVAFVLHCHAVRTNLAKTDTIDQQGMYVLRSDWEEIDGPLDETPGKSHCNRHFVDFDDS